MTHPEKAPLVLLVSIVALLLFNNCGAAMSQETTGTLAAKIRIAGNGGEAVISLYDSPMSKDFVSLLPLTLTFRDYEGEEKIANTPRRLETAGGLAANTVQGDFAYYAPWGNLAVFYKGFGKGNGLYTLGRIESGKEWLAGQQDDFAAQIEIIGQPTQTAHE